MDTNEWYFSEFSSEKGSKDGDDGDNYKDEVCSLNKV